MCMKKRFLVLDIRITADSFTGLLLLDGNQKKQRKQIWQQHKSACGTDQRLTVWKTKTDTFRVKSIADSDLVNIM